MILEGIAAASALLAGRYLIPSKRARRLGEVAFRRVSGSYRDPALYEVTVTSPGEKERYYKVRNVKEIPEPDKALVIESFEERHRWMDSFLTGKDCR